MKTLRKWIASRLPPEWKRWLRHRRAAWRYRRDLSYDARRYLAASTTVRPPADQVNVEAQLIFDYHRIEKGLAMPESRPGFGKDTIVSLMRALPAHEASFGPTAVGQSVEDVLRSYAADQRRQGVPNEELEAFLAARRSASTAPALPGVEPGGFIQLELDRLFPVDSQISRRFLTSRRSVRQFTGAPVPDELMDEAVHLAQRAPSVCNRQGGRLYMSNDPKVMARMLAHQNGNRGFGQTLGAVFIVAEDMRIFMNVGERNQAFVDGGIFAMSLVQGLHALHLGACLLNWSATAGADMALRREFGIPDHHAVITMVGAGYPVDPVRVAASPRILPGDVAVRLN